MTDSGVFRVIEGATLKEPRSNGYSCLLQIIALIGREAPEAEQRSAATPFRNVRALRSLTGHNPTGVFVMKRTILTGVALTVAMTLFHVVSAEAQVSSGRNPWCLRDGPLGRGSWDCTYHSYDQCWFSSVYGSDGSCVPNPNYRGPRQNRNPRGAQDGRR